jgi:hypothetical protein
MSARFSLPLRRASSANRAVAPTFERLGSYVAPLFLVALSLFLVCGAAHADPNPVRVHIRGTSRIEPHAGRLDGKLVLSGVLVDDGARPLAGETVGVSVATDDDRAHPLSLAGGGAVAPCDGASGAGARPTLVRSDRVDVATDSGGRFCVQIELALSRYVARFSFDGGARVDGAQAEIAGDVSLHAVTLWFDPEPRVLDLDATSTPTLDAIATVDDDNGSSPAPGLTLTLSNERGASLGVATTSGVGRARFSLALSQLGPPGDGDLRVAFLGNGGSAAATHVAPIERRVRVDLSAPDAHDGKLPAGSPDEGVAIEVVASARAAADEHVFPTGMVVARVGDIIVGAGPLTEGRARVVVTFGSAAATEALVRFEYASDAPWFLRGNETTVAIPIRAPSLWRNLPFLVAGACVLAWLVLGRARFDFKSNTEVDRPTARPPAWVEAGVQILRAEPGSTGWRGTVVDAHDGRPIADACVSLERHGFDGVAILSTTITDGGGGFSLAGVAVLEGDKLVSEAPFHARLELRAPTSGEIAIALVLRRRALLDRLVAWAKRRGSPFDAPVEPTPGQVRRAAGTSFGVARWADAVERAAFGGAQVDARAELEVERLAPDAPAVDRVEGGLSRDRHESDTIKDAVRENELAEGLGPDGRPRDE